MQRVALGPTETLLFTAPRLFSDSDDVFVRRIYSCKCVYNVLYVLYTINFMLYTICTLHHMYYIYYLLYTM
jgi:hypothetical protein